MCVYSKFKLRTLVSLLALGALGPVMADTPAQPTPVTANGGTIHFTGEIVNSACAVDNDSSGQTVKLGQFRAAALAKKDAVSSAVPFSIKLTDCELGGDEKNAPYSKVSVKFSGNSVEGNPKAIALSGAQSGAASTDAAKNLGIQILQDGTPLTIDGTTASTAKPITAGENVLYFSAAYIATADNVTAGVANADATFKLTYE